VTLPAISKLIVAEDAQAMSKAAMKKLSQVSTIEVTLQDCGPARVVAGLGLPPAHLADVGLIPEKAVKGDAKSHRAG